MKDAFTLVHSPLVGPATWTGVGSELRARGHDVAMPSLEEAAVTGRWQDCVEIVVGASVPAGRRVIVGHSGAGPLLPVVASRLDVPPRAIVFVDAALPPEQGDAALAPDEFLGRLRELATETDGRLPPWSEWFGPDAMAALVPDVALRRAIVAELPRLPLSYFDQHVPMPDEWVQLRCAYLLLSELYRADAESARSRGWPTVERLGGHLDMVTRPGQITDALLELVTL